MPFELMVRLFIREILEDLNFYLLSQVNGREFGGNTLAFIFQQCSKLVFKCMLNC